MSSKQKEFVAFLMRKMRLALRKYGKFFKSIKSYAVNDITESKHREIYDWSVKDTILGTVRDGVQLEFILKNNSYYVPAIYITEDTSPIRYIALHEQGIGSEPGICRYGKVISMKKVKRKIIPVPLSRDNSDELYCYFKVHCWKKLPRAIDIRDTHRGAPLFTNKFLLDNCTQSYQLFSVFTDGDYRLTVAVNTAFDDMHGSDYKNFSAAYPINETYILKVSNGCFSIVNNEDRIIESISVGSFYYRPRDGFNKFKNAIKY